MPNVAILCRVRALYTFDSTDRSSLDFIQGDTIDVLNKLPSGWWDGICNGTRGWFPSNYVQVLETFEEPAAPQQPVPSPRPPHQQQQAPAAMYNHASSSNNSSGTSTTMHEVKKKKTCILYEKYEKKKSQELRRVLP
ncbi:SH3 domain-containing protein [Gongronella butleri]|nr:SH3 domain-containing protein [Gongronella butleri]